MKRLLLALAFLLCAASPSFALDCADPQYGYTQGPGGWYLKADRSGPYSLDSTCAGSLIGGSATAGATAPASQYPTGAVPVTASATGTTGATTATLPASATKTTYLCGFSIRANATAAATGNATVTGLIAGTLNFTQWTAPLASGLGAIEEHISLCIPGSAVNTGIAVISAAPGSGGTVSVSAWGYQL